MISVVLTGCFGGGRRSSRSPAADRTTAAPESESAGTAAQPWDVTGFDDEAGRSSLAPRPGQDPSTPPATQGRVVSDPTLPPARPSMLPGYVESTLGLDFDQDERVHSHHDDATVQASVDESTFSSPRLPPAEVTDRRWDAPIDRSSIETTHQRPPTPEVVDRAPPAPQPTTTERKPIVDDRVSTTSYTVQPGDTLFGIARRHGLSVDELLRLNPQVSNADSLYADDRLSVPAP